MPGRKREPSFQLASGTTAERDGSYNLTTLGSVFYNTDTSNVEVYHEDPSNTLGWRDLVMNNKEQIDISGNVSITSTGALTLPVGTTDQQPTSVMGMVRFNSELDLLEFYNSSGWRQIIYGVLATGGAVTEVGSYRIHTFTQSGAFSVSVGGNVEYLVVAGGGSGANQANSNNRGGGGGGAGGLLKGNFNTVSGRVYTITTGAQGTQTDTAYYTVGTDGGDSSISDGVGIGITATGGGRGGTGSLNLTPGDGGSGGGAGSGASVYAPGSGTSGQGYGGGGGNTGSSRSGGGGGGAGGVGQNYQSYAGNYSIANGGVGVESTITGTAVTYAIGGSSSLSGSYLLTKDDSGGNPTHITRSANTGDGGHSGEGMVVLPLTRRPSPGDVGIVIIRYLM